ncbi:hypothetical protein [Actinospica robiniae]|uniref:hypothetical protein n=1 Tax=Actinospica robiniae TaxID=304901 RepID=UPI00042A4524|nr:hypothetical protein [Actinospica robiniae]
MPVNDRSDRRPEGKTAWGRRIFHGVSAVLLAATIVLGCFEMSWASQDAAQGMAFAAAPACPPGAAPTGNCVGWEQVTVSSVVVGKSAVGVHLSLGGQTLSFGNKTAWPSTLTSGASIPVLVWRNEAQALRDPSGEILYSDNAAGHGRYDDIATALCPFGFVLGMYVWLGALDAPPLRMRRPRLWLSLNVIGGSVGAALFVAGVTIQDTRSVDSGIIGGVIVLVPGLLVTTGIAVLVRRHRVRAAELLAG